MVYVNVIIPIDYIILFLHKSLHPKTIYLLYDHNLNSTIILEQHNQSRPVFLKYKAYQNSVILHFQNHKFYTHHYQLRYYQAFLPLYKYLYVSMNDIIIMKVIYSIQYLMKTIEDIIL